MNKTVAIIGGSGFLGRCLSTRLAQAGHKVFAVARSVDPRQMPPGVTCVQATIDDAQALAPVLAEADYLLHLAWDTTPGTSQLQPVLEASNNLLPTLRLLEQMQRFPRCRIVFLSSGGAIYSERCPAPWNEQSGLEPRSYYGAGKIAIEYMLGAYHAQTGNGVIVVRPSNVYGPGQHSKRLFAIVPTLMRCLLEQREFEIWGDGNNIRDYLFIRDFEDFVLRLLARECPDAVNETFNVGSGRGVSINELCTTLETISGRQLHRSYLARRAVDTGAVVLDSDKALRVLGWTARTSLADGLEATWKWFLGLK